MCVCVCLRSLSAYHILDCSEYLICQSCLAGRPAMSVLRGKNFNVGLCASFSFIVHAYRHCKLYHVVPLSLTLTLTLIGGHEVSGKQTCWLYFLALCSKYGVFLMQFKLTFFFSPSLLFVVGFVCLFGFFLFFFFSFCF